MAKLFFFTAEFPYGTGETFIENEITFQPLFFDQVYVFSNKIHGGKTRKTPEKVTAIQLPEIKSKNFFLIRNSGIVLEILLTEFYHTKSKWFFIKNIPLWLSYIKKAFKQAKQIELFVGENGNATDTFYSYWMNDWVLALAILKRKKIINDFSFRCGGFDIWDERHEKNYLPFRYFNYKYAKRIYPNSAMGEKYLKALNYHPSKIKLAYWGTPDYGCAHVGSGITLTLVSCSGLIPLKRVLLIADALGHVKREIRWIHFGDGEQMVELAQKVKKFPANISCELKGNVSNNTVHEFYRSNAVDFFITTSSTESLPVSIQEAMSYGVPVIATNVGGISEMVAQECTGYLLAPNPTALDVSEKIESLNLQTWRSLEKRTEVRLKWQELFSATKNYAIFFENLK